MYLKFIKIINSKTKIVKIFYITMYFQNCKTKILYKITLILKFITIFTGRSQQSDKWRDLKKYEIFLLYWFNIYCVLIQTFFNAYSNTNSKNFENSKLVLINLLVNLK